MKSALIAFLMASGSTPAALAQSAPVQDGPVAGAEGEYVVVTAQRREQKLNEVPLAISSLSGDVLEELDATDITKLTAATPGISGVAQGILSPIIAIRGVSSNSFGIGGEASVGIFVDEAYIGRLSASSVPFLDVERVEILRGPQGSLYGRNSTAGAISIVTKKPSMSERRIELTGSYGSFKAHEATMSWNQPISDKTALRIALLARGDDAYDRNVFTGSKGQDIKSYGGRISLSSELSSVLNLDAAVSFSREDAGAYPFKNIDPRYAGLPASDQNPFSSIYAHDAGGFEKRKSFGANARLTWDMSDNLSLKSITSYNYSNVSSSYDIDGTSLPLIRSDFSDGIGRTFGQELRFTYESEPLTLQFGGSFFKEKIRDARSAIFDETLYVFDIVNKITGGSNGEIPANFISFGDPGFTICDATSNLVFGAACSGAQTETLRQRGNYRSLSAFVEAEYEVSDQLTVIAGGRYSNDRKRFFFASPFVNSVTSQLIGNNLFRAATNGESFKKTWKDFQPRLVVRFQPNEDINLFASATRGYKSGGYDPAVENGATSRDRTQFGAESVWNYEIGGKFSYGRSQFNISAYRMNYKGFQVQFFQNSLTSTLNVPKYNGFGLEADVNFRVGDALTLAAGGALSGAEYGNFIVDDPATGFAKTVNLKGNRGIVAPKTSFFARADYSQPVSDKLNFKLGLDMDWRSRQFFTIYNNPAEGQRAYGIVNGLVGVESEDGNWAVSLVGRNLFNKDYLTSAIDYGFGIVTNRGRPRTIAVDARLGF